MASINNILLPNLDEFSPGNLLSSIQPPARPGAHLSVLDEIWREGPVELAAGHAASVFCEVDGRSVGGSSCHCMLCVILCFTILGSQNVYRWAEVFKFRKWLER